MCNEMLNFFSEKKIKPNFKLLFAEIFAIMLKVLDTCNVEVLLHSSSEGQDQHVLPHSLIWIFSGLFLFTYILYIYFIIGQMSWSDIILIKY